MTFKTGDKIKYIGTRSLFITYNSVGTIISEDKDNCGWYVLFSDGIEWFCANGNLIKIPTKNQQLLFNFMD